MSSVKNPKPSFLTRTEWGCPDGQTTNHGTLGYTLVTHLIVHHTVNDNDAPDWSAVVLDIWKFHVFERGFADIGYNYLIAPNGVIYEGRAGGENVQGAHFSGVNEGTMGVGMIGTYIEVEPTEAALLSLKKLFSWKCIQDHLNPIGSSLHTASQLELCTISGHCDGPNPTQCPGDLLYELLPVIRKDVNRLVGSRQ